MLAILDALGSIACAWGRAMQHPLHAPVPVPPAPTFSVYAYDARIKANLRSIEEAKRAAAEPAPLLPSTDYRTNPRPSQVATVPRCYY